MTAERKKRRADTCIVILFSLLAYLPTTDTGNIIRLSVVVFCLLWSLLLSGGRFYDNELALPLCILLSPIISGAFVYFVEGAVNVDKVYHEITRMAFCAASLVVIQRTEISEKVLLRAASIVFFPNFIIQILEYIKFEPVFDFLSENYVTESDLEYGWSHLELARETGMSFRSGAIFLNPNIFMIIPLLFLCIVLHLDRKKSSMRNTFFILMAGLSCLLTGSRTALIAMFAIIMVYLFKYASRGRKTSLILLALVIFAFFGAFLLSNSRAFDLDMSDSLEYKVSAYWNYWRKTSSVFLYWLTGSLGTNDAYYYNMDSELGFIYSWFGVFGVYWYVKYYKQALATNAGIPFYPTATVLICLLVSVTASVMLCMPVCSFAMVILFSKIRSDEAIEQVAA